MTLSDIKESVMFQTDNDQADLGDFMPFLLSYINEGYDRLLYVWNHEHLKTDTDFPPLLQDNDVPVIPQWAHQAICDWATWRIYENGNGSRQNRGAAFRNSFFETRGRLLDATGSNFINIPK